MSSHRLRGMDQDFLQGSSEPIQGGMDMSLALHDKVSDTSQYQENEFVEAQRDMDHLNRYLAIMEANKKSCRFVPDDALIALDMAGFVRDCLNGHRPAVPVSTARMALSLVQGHYGTPVQ